jgi:prephenate dehydrogenase
MAPTFPAAHRLVLLGPGLLGASIGLALRARGWGGRIVGVARRAETLERARARGAIDEGGGDLEQALAEGDELIVLCAPLGAFEGLMEALAAHQRPSMVVTDVGSTKGAVCEQARRLLPHPSRFVGAHPMAGSEQQGPDAARADLFEGRPCVVTPESHTDPAARAEVERLWGSLGMRLRVQDPAAHDRQAAAASHLPHLSSVLLVEAAREAGALGLASSGFRDSTRLALSNPGMRCDILASNREAIAAAARRMAGRLEEVANRLEAGDEASLRDLLERNRATRAEWAEGQEEGGNEKGTWSA